MPELKAGKKDLKSCVLLQRKEQLIFIADIKLSKTATVEKVLEEYINKHNKTGKI